MCYHRVPDRETAPRGRPRRQTRSLRGGHSQPGIAGTKRRLRTWERGRPARIAAPDSRTGGSDERGANGCPNRGETRRQDEAGADANPPPDAPRTHRVRRPAGAVYHFLLPDPGMVAYADKAAKALMPEPFERIGEWRKGFFKPFTNEQIAELEALSDRVDELWATHTEQLARDHRETEDTLPVWGQPAPARERRTTNTWKDRIRAQGIFSEDARTASPYRRLKLVMDYWCALWFWPIEAADRLPDRDDFLNEITLVLTGSVFQPGLGPTRPSTSSARSPPTSRARTVNGSCQARLSATGHQRMVRRRLAGSGRRRQHRVVCVVLELLHRVSEHPLRHGMAPVAGAIPGPSRRQPGRSAPASRQGAQGSQRGWGLPRCPTARPCSKSAPHCRPAERMS